METSGVAAPSAPVASRGLWQYRVAWGFLAVGMAGFAFAPFSGIVYVALPGVALATYTAFVRHSALRLAWALSSAAFVLGFIIGVSGLAFAGVGAASNSFITEEWGYFMGAAALWLLPLFGLLTGTVALVGTYVRRER